MRPLRADGQLSVLEIWQNIWQNKVFAFGFWGISEGNGGLLGPWDRYWAEMKEDKGEMYGGCTCCSVMAYDY